MIRRTYFNGRVRSGFLLANGLALLAAFIILVAWPGHSGPSEVSLSEIQRAVDAGDVVSATIDDEARVIEVERTDGSRSRAAYPSSFGDELVQHLADSGAEVTVEPAQRTPLWLRMVVAFLPFAAIVAAFLLYTRFRSGSSFGRGRQLRAAVPDTRFADIAGVDEVVAEVAEIVDFLRDPTRFTRSGARPPRGVLLTGPPGTGKTMIARAVAGESGVPFFAMSGSDFVETYAGVGAARVRRVFQIARKQPKAIVFIDEIDAVGKSRHGGPSGGYVDERERTLNLLLVEMDGFEKSDVIVLAATNRADVLDPALLRPGRFDRTIAVPPPDRRGRTQILELMTRHRRLDPDVDLVELARQTPGLTGADLSALVNEAALEGARAGANVISRMHVERALGTTLLGRERPSALVSDQDRSITAWHEAGHATCALLLPEIDDPTQVSIVPRGVSGGATWLVPGDDRLLRRQQLSARLVVMMGGRAGEEVLLGGEFTNGPADDLRRARLLATEMAVRYGMAGDGVGHGGLAGAELPPDALAETNMLLEDALRRARSLLATNEALLHQIAVELLDDETLHADRLRGLRNELGSLDPAGASSAMPNRVGLEPSGLPSNGNGRQL